MVTQKFIKPATYLVNGQKRAYSREYLNKVATETNRMLADGLRVPFLGSHTKPDDSRGLPSREPSQDAVEISKGWLKGIKVHADGWLEHEIDVTDPAAQAAIKNGSVAFTSPQFTESITDDGVKIVPQKVDGLGRVYGPVITHIAMTPNPRNPEQGAFQFGDSVQFSLEDIETEEEPKEEESKEESPVVEPEANPDIPVEEKDDPKSQAIIVGLAQQSIILPAGIKFPAEIADVLIAAINSANAAKSATEAESKDESIKDETLEEVQPVQFSNEELASYPPAVRKALEQAVKDRQAAVQFALDKAEQRRSAALAELKGNKKLPPALRAKLVARAETVQFSADREPTTLTVLEAARLFSDHLPAQFSADTLTSDSLREVLPPSDEGRENLTDADIEKTYAEVMGGFRPQKKHK